jgi:RimJ/RimL family protein N-acetyltransferase
MVDVSELAVREHDDPSGGRVLEAPSLLSGHTGLRAWRREDAPALAGACGDALICAYTTIPRRFSEAAAAEWIERQIRALHAGTSLVLAIETAGSSMPVGAVWLFAFDEPWPRSARVGGWVRVEHRGQGLMTVAIRMLAQWAFSELKLEALELCFEADNLASRRVSEKLGARRTGSLAGARSQVPTVLEHHTLSGPVAGD